MPDAAYNLGVMYTEGQGIGQDFNEAVRLFRSAAEQGHSDAQFNLGGMYATGRGVVRNDVEAYKWVALAAAKGDQDARKALERLAARMSPAQVEAARQSESSWVPCKSKTECEVRLK